LFRFHRDQTETARPLIDLEAIREQQAVENRLPVTVNGSEAEAFSPLRRRPPGTGASSA
jgi:hypothetical protein